MSNLHELEAFLALPVSPIMSACAKGESEQANVHKWHIIAHNIIIIIIVGVCGFGYLAYQNQL